MLNYYSENPYDRINDPIPKIKQEASNDPYRFYSYPIENMKSNTLINNTQHVAYNN